jgi:hypothetical protein
METSRPYSIENFIKPLARAFGKETEGMLTAAEMADLDALKARPRAVRSFVRL